MLHAIWVIRKLIIYEKHIFDYINTLDQENWLFITILYIGSIEIELKLSIVMYLYSIAAEQNCHILRILKQYKYINRVSKSLDSRHWLTAFSHSLEVSPGGNQAIR